MVTNSHERFAKARAMENAGAVVCCAEANTSVAHEIPGPTSHPGAKGAATATTTSKFA